MSDLNKRRRYDSAEDKMLSALWGCFGLAGIVSIILGAGGYFIVRWVLA